MSSNADRENGQNNPDESDESPILRKVRATLLKTAPSQWVEAGEALDSQRKYIKMVDTWEHLFVLELKKGFLVLRCSTPVIGQFHGGGYALTPRALPNYTIELRDRSWDYRELTDLARRSAAGGKSTIKKFETLAHGDTAHDLFENVAKQVQSFFKEKDGEFELVVAELLKTLEEMADKGFTSAWQKKSEHGNTVTWYRSKIGEVQVISGRQTRKDSATNYKLTLTNAEGLSRTYSNNLSKKVFDAAEDFDKNAGLLKLDALLTELE